MSSAGDDRRWQAWQMGPLERRRRLQPASAPATDAPEPPAAAPRTRRREDRIRQKLLDRALRQAAKKGYADGHAAGLEAGRLEGAREIRQEQAETLAAETVAHLAAIDRLVAGFGQAARALDERIGRQLAELAIETGRQLAGRALEIRPEHIVDDIQDLLHELPGLTGSPTLYIATDDLARVEHHLGQSLASANWRLRADAALAPGDCRIEDDEREIESSQADRWARLLQAVGHSEH